MAATCLLYAQPQWVTFSKSTPQPPIIQLASSDSLSVNFTAEICGMYETDTTVNNIEFQRLYIPGGGCSHIVGDPEMPYVRQLIAIPECDSVILTVDIKDNTSFENYYVYPAPDHQTVMDHDSSLYVEEVFILNSTTYNSNQYYPNITAEIHSIGHFRGQKYAEIFLFPVRFNPILGEIDVDINYDVTLTFVNPTTSINVNVGIFNNIATNVLLNYPSTGISPLINDDVDPNGSVEWVTLTSPNQASSINADYLIICEEALFDPEDSESEVLRIANHRATYNGYNVTILNASNIISDELGFYYEGSEKSPLNDTYKKEQRIRTCIRMIYEGANALHTYDGHLAYVLLIGDTCGAWNLGMPTSFDPNPGDNYNGDEYPSDYYYSCVTKDENGSYDREGDLFIGRFSVEYFSPYNEIELHNIVEKTMKFETEYCLEGYKNNVTHTNGNIDMHSEHYWEDFYYPFITGLLNAYNPNIILNYVDGYIVNGQIKEPTLDNLNEGALTMLYCGHGFQTAWQSFNEQGGADDLQIADFESDLTTDYTYPFCSAITCLNGMFDTPVDCLAEALTTYSSTKGFVGCLAAGREVIIGFNNPYHVHDIQSIIPYVIWNNHSYIVGEYILQAKTESIQQTDQFAYNLFGDPGLNIMAQGYEITHDVTIPETASINKEVYLRSDNTVTVPSNSTLYLENDGKLIIEDGATLELEDNAVVHVTSGADSLIVYGDIDVGSYVNFVADEGSSLVIDFRNDDLIKSIGRAIFNNVKITGRASVLIIASSDFTNSNIEYYRLTNSQYVLDNSTFTNTTVKACRADGPATDAGNLVITGCTFDNQIGESVVDLEGFHNFRFHTDTLRYSTGDGISLYHAGSAIGTLQEIMNCEIYFTGDPSEGNHQGVIAYRSYITMANNYIHGNTIGVSCLNQSDLGLLGNEYSESPDETQQILNNWTSQVYSDGSSFPYEFEYNYIDNEVNDDYLICVSNSPRGQYVVRNNYWGEDFSPNDDFFPRGAFDYIPVWEPSWHQFKSSDPAREIFYSAKQNIIDSNYISAKEKFQDIIETYPESRYQKAAVKELLALAEINDYDFMGLQTYLDSVPTLWNDDDAIQITEHVMNWCNIEVGDYPTAIDWFEDRIMNPVNFVDSVLCVIDLEYTYTLMDNISGREDGYIGKFPQYKPTSRENFEKTRSYLIDLLIGNKKQSSQNDNETLDGEKDMNMSIFPNPANDEITIHYYLQDDSKVSIKIFNPVGDLIKILDESIKSSGNQMIKLDVNNYSPGVLFMALYLNDKLVEVKKMIIEK